MKKFLKIATATCAVLCLFVCGIGFFGFKSIKAEAKIDASALPKNGPATTVTDSLGNEIFEFESYVTLAEMPKAMIDAFVAVEDKRFFEHNGIDYKRVAGAMLKNIKAKKPVEGASTITQQLVKNTLLTSEKTLERKINEMALAEKMESVYDKNEILEMYLNVIYLGGGNYGVGSAAKYYFGKKVSELSISECATIAGITKNPAKFNPKTNPKFAKNRRNLILNLMKAQGYISETELEIETNKQIKTVEISEKTENCYVKEAISEAAKILGISKKQLANCGYEISTYFDKNAQRAAERAKTESDDDAESVVLICDNKTAGIVALFSNASTEINKLRRQIASTAKPILVYGPAIEEGVITLASPLTDRPTSFAGYEPKNFGGGYYGNVSAKFAISKSLNVPAVATLQKMGTDTALSYAEKMGLSLSENDKNLSLALGGLTDGLTFTELSGAYMTLANGGRFVRPSYIDKITLNGTVVYQNPKRSESVFSPETAYLVSEALLDAANNGTAKKLNSLGFPVYAKTGTNSREGKNIDAYSVGYTSAHTFLSWRGKSDNSPLGDLDTGGNAATESLAKVASALYERFAPSPIEKPENILRTKFDLEDFENGTLLLASPLTPEGYFFEELVTEKDVQNFKMSENFLFPKAENVFVTSDGNAATVEFLAKKPFVYQIYSVDIFGREETIFERNGTDEQVKTEISIGFLKNYYIKCGFVDYFGNLTFGEPEKIAVYSGINFFS